MVTTTPLPLLTEPNTADLAPWPPSDSSAVATSSATSAQFSREEAQHLFQYLIKHGWHRLKPEYDDPINMLYDDLPASEWTMGWDPKENTLYLLLWKKVSWQTQPSWQLYVNGIQRFECTETSFPKEAALCQELLESTKLTYLTFPNFLSRITDYHIPQEQREDSLKRLSTTIKNNPTLWNTLKHPFYHYLSKGLNTTQQPTLDLLKIHSLEQKNWLLQALKEWVGAGFVDTLEEKRLLNRLLNNIHYEYEKLGPLITPLAKPTYEKAYKTFQQVIAQGFWRIQLFQTSFKASHNLTFPITTPC